MKADAFGNCQDSLYSMHKISLEKFPQISRNIVVPLATSPDQIATSSLIKFIQRFGTKTMVIYDALL
jgi:hypothetical protein